MKKSNDTDCVTFRSKHSSERYYRDPTGWLKVSTRDRVIQLSPEQVLHHLLPALAFGEQLGLEVTVEHHETPYWQLVGDQAEAVVGSGASGSPPNRPAGPS